MLLGPCHTTQTLVSSYLMLILSLFLSISNKFLIRKFLFEGMVRVVWKGCQLLEILFSSTHVAEKHTVILTEFNELFPWPIFYCSILLYSRFYSIFSFLVSFLYSSKWPPFFMWQHFC